MPTASGFINISKITSIKYATVDPTLSTAPVSLKDVTTAMIKQGGFKLEFAAPSVTQQFLENGSAYNATSAPAAQSATIELAKAPASLIADFTPSTFTAGTADTVPDKLKFGAAGSSVTNKYVEILGLNSDGKVIKVTLFNTGVTYSWSGANGESVEPTAFTIQFSIFYSAGFDGTYSVDPMI